MSEISKEQAYKNEIPDVHLRGKVSTEPQSVEAALSLLSHTGQIHNEKSIMKAIDYLLARDRQEKLSLVLRQEIASILAQIVVFNEKKNPDLATKVREILNTFIS